MSSCEHGKGRAAADRQFIAINGRPCDHTKVRDMRPLSLDLVLLFSLGLASEAWPKLSYER